jgi:hypothetical protein
MKRSVQMKNAGIPVDGMRSDIHFRGFRGIGKPKREWQPGPLVVRHPNRGRGDCSVRRDTIPKMTTELIVPVPRKEGLWERLINWLLWWAR